MHYGILCTCPNIHIKGSWEFHEKLKFTGIAWTVAPQILAKEQLALIKAPIPILQEQKR